MTKQRSLLLRSQLESHPARLHFMWHEKLHAWNSPRISVTLFAEHSGAEPQVTSPAEQGGTAAICTGLDIAEKEKRVPYVLKWDVSHLDCLLVESGRNVYGALA
jgi:hypothetical protein